MQHVVAVPPAVALAQEEHEVGIERSAFCPGREELSIAVRVAVVVANDDEAIGRPALHLAAQDRGERDRSIDLLDEARHLRVRRVEHEVVAPIVQGIDATLVRRAELPGRTVLERVRARDEVHRGDDRSRTHLEVPHVLGQERGHELVAVVDQVINEPAHVRAAALRAGHDRIVLGAVVGALAPTEEAVGECEDDEHAARRHSDQSLATEAVGVQHGFHHPFCRSVLNVHAL